MTSPFHHGTLLLVITLGVGSVWDIRTRTIPVGVMAILAFMGAVTIPEWSWTGALVGVLGMSLAGLPDGDRAACYAAGGLVGPVGTAWALAACLGGWALVAATVGRSRPVIGWPYFPWQAGAFAAAWFLR